MSILGGLSGQSILTRRAPNPHPARLPRDLRERSDYRARVNATGYALSDEPPSIAATAQRKLSQSLLRVCLRILRTCASSSPPIPPNSFAFLPAPNTLIPAASILAHTLRKGSPMPTATPCALVIFGASGDLAKLKLIPAIYELAHEKLLPEKFALIGYGRKEISDDEFRNICKDAVLRNSRSVKKDKKVDEAVLSRLINASYFCSGGYGDGPSFEKLKAKLADCDQKHGTAGNRLFYMSTPPDAFVPIVKGLGAGKLAVRRASASTASGSASSSRSRSAAPEGGPGIEQPAAPGSSRRAGLPHRPLPGQRNRAEPDGDAVRQLDLRADLELQIHRSRADHGERRRWASAIARRLLRQERRTARHGAEPHVPAHGAGGDGAAGGAGCGQHSR